MSPQRRRPARPRVRWVIRACGVLRSHPDANDADYLRYDPTIREVVGRMQDDKRGASSGAMARLETDFLPDIMNFDV